MTSSHYEPGGIDWAPTFVGMLFWSYRRERMARKFRAIFCWGRGS